jgi:cytochrome P450
VEVVNVCSTDQDVLSLFINRIRVGDRQDSWINLRKANEKYGDTFMIVGLDGSYLKTSNAEVIGQVTLRRNDFLKPVERYKIVDIFGKNILTTEGSEWRRHRKIVGPSFSEKSNKLVFEESLRQAESMLEFWISKQGNMRREVRVSETAADLATLNVNVICAAGFGVPQLWPGESEDKLQGNVLPGFNTYLLKGDHTLPFKKSMVLILRHLLWLVVLPPWILSMIPIRPFP